MLLKCKTEMGLTQSWSCYKSLAIIYCYKHKNSITRMFEFDVIARRKILTISMLFLFKSCRVGMVLVLQKMPNENQN